MTTAELAKDFTDILKRGDDEAAAKKYNSDDIVSYEAMDGADALVIVTEWDAFRALDLNRAKSLLNEPVLVDLRNIYPREAVEKAGFRYTSVGR